MDTGLRGLVEQAYRARGGKGETLPGASQISGRGRVDLRCAVDDAGELYILTKPDGMIRKVVGAEVSTTSTVTTVAPPGITPAPLATAPGPGSAPAAAGTAAAIRNPVPPTPASMAAGKIAYEATCAACHGKHAEGAVKAGVSISIIEEHGGKQPSDLTDSQWDYGASDGEIFAVMKRGVPSTMMPGFDGALSDTDMWNIVNYLRDLASRK